MLLALLPSLTFDPSALVVPGNTSYLVQPVKGRLLPVDGDWNKDDQRLIFGGSLGHAGDLHPVLHLQLPAGQTAAFQLMVRGQTKRAEADGSGTVDFGDIPGLKPGWVVFLIQGIQKSGAGYGTPLDLSLTGESVADSRFNLKSRKNTASVHFRYPLPEGRQATWFYNEIKVGQDPLNTYFMACGFARGYFGIQVNSGTERRVIFSVWDSGNEAVDRNKVASDNQVRLLAKGDGVFASGFGNEGTGGHSHLGFSWKTSEAQKFLLHAQPAIGRTTYTAYYWRNDLHQWMTIAKFDAPKDGQSLRDLYSFIEDFDGDNGYLERSASYGPAWAKLDNGQWVQLRQAVFTHDGTGGRDRFDYACGVRGGRFTLQTGGFTGASPESRTKLEAPAEHNRSAELEQIVQKLGGK